MKKVLQSIVLLLGALMLPATAAAFDFEVDGIYYNISGNEATVTHGTTSYAGDVIIPSTVTYDGTTYSVASIGLDAFYNCSGLTSVDIPNSVTTINHSAFYFCTSLASVTIGNSVTTIGKWAFADCSSLTSLTLPNTVRTIGDYALYNCTKLTSMIIPDAVVSIGDNAFYHCHNLASVTIGNSVTTIGKWAFDACSSLASVTIPKSVTAIGERAFSYTGLTSIVVASENTTYDSRNDCNAIINTATNTLITGCQNTVIPRSVTAIGDYAFFNCMGLASVDIPCSVSAIGNSAFGSCSSLKSVTMPNTVKTIGTGAFSKCSSLTSVTIPNSVTTLGSEAFNNCYKLASVTIGNSVTAIEEKTFYSCSSLTSVDIPNSVITIGNSAFHYCSHLASVTIGNSVTAIGRMAFYGCSGLTGVTFPNSLTAIRDAAFCQCTGLTNVTIPNSVTSIGYAAFYQCSGLTDVYSLITDLSNVTSQEYMFALQAQDGNFDYSGRTLHVPHGSTAAYQADMNWYPYFGQIEEDLIPGDVNGDLEVNIADVNAVIDVIFSDVTNPSADVNGDGEINIGDINAVIDIILGGGPTPPSNIETFTVNGISFKMVKVEGGTFTMGASDDDTEAFDREKPAHEVTLSSYSIGQTEVTQELWQAVMGSNPSEFTGDLSRPVEQMSWNDCETFITKLNEMTGKQFRLPTEAEWEFAARGGNLSQGYIYAGSNTIDDVAWYSGNSSSTTHPVATKAPNELGLYDMSGNVWEWCQDWYGAYSSAAQTNPTGPTSGSDRVSRGGCWGSLAGGCRVSYRYGSYPSYRDYILGLRLALSDNEQHEWVDLGLPSGTLWATCNVGANAPEEYGDYFAWGETAPKNYYDWSTYKWCKGSYNTLTKYCTKSDYGYNGFTDGKKELDASDDAATANWGSGARMPSSEQIQELRDNCSWQWTQRNGVYGQQGTGLNGSTIFLPATGYFWYGLLYHAGMDGSYWSRTLRPSNSDLAYNLLVTSGHGYQYYNFRDYGHTVRAVRVSQN